MLKKKEVNQSLFLVFFKNFLSCIENLAATFTSHGVFQVKKKCFSFVFLFKEVKEFTI